MAIKLPINSNSKLLFFDKVTKNYYYGTEDVDTVDSSKKIGFVFSHDELLTDTTVFDSYVLGLSQYNPLKLLFNTELFCHGETAEYRFYGRCFGFDFSDFPKEPSIPIEQKANFKDDLIINSQDFKNVSSPTTYASFKVVVKVSEVLDLQSTLYPYLWAVQIKSTDTNFIFELSLQGVNEPEAKDKALLIKSWVGKNVAIEVPRYTSFADDKILYNCLSVELIS